MANVGNGKWEVVRVFWDVPLGWFRRVREAKNSRTELRIPDNRIPPTPRNFAVGTVGSVRVKKWMNEFVGMCIDRCSGCQWFAFRSI